MGRVDSMGFQSWPGVDNQERFLMSEAATGIRSLLPVTFDINGPLDTTLLVRAIERTISEQPMLRAHARLDHPTGCHIQVAPNGIPVSLHDLSDLSSNQQIKSQADILKEEMFYHDGQFRTILIKLAQHNYTLTLIPHHSVIDGVSINSIIDQISRLYNNNGNAPYSEKKSTKSFFSHYSKIETGGTQSDFAYWSNYLEGLPEQPGLPAALGRSGDAVDQTGCSVHLVEPWLHKAIRTSARQIGVRTFTFYLNVIMIALTRLTGEPDLAITIQSSGRRSHGLPSEIIGMFSKALILRTPLKSETTAARLQTIDHAITNALAHEAASYHSVIRHNGTTPRYAVNWFPPHPGLQLKGCSTHERIIVPWPTTFDINLHVVKTHNRVELRVFHNLSRIDPELAHHVGRLVLSLLRQMVNNSEDASRHLASPGHGAVGRAAPRRESQPRLEKSILDQAESNPDAPAIRHADGLLSYLELSVAVRQLATRIPKGARAAVIGHRGPGVVIGALAVLKAGGTFVLIDPCYPIERIQAILTQVDPHVIMTGDSLFSDFAKIASGQSEPGGVPGIGQLILCPTTQAPQSEPYQTAYYLFTSGSTGTPKGISSDHAPLAHAVAWQTETFDINSSIRCAFLSGIGHDPALRDIFLPLSLGGTLISPDPARLFEPGYLHRWLCDERITLAHLTPSMIHLIATGADNAACPMLRHVFVGGERVDSHIVDTLRRIAPNALVINVYGASETPQIVLCNPLVNHGTVSDPLPIGRPRPDVATHILDGDERACGYYEPGEICIETPYMSNGYLDTELTQKSFRFSPDTHGPGLYRTGDMGYVTPEKNVFLIGRKDDQVKIRGYRIELGEVQTALRKAAAPNAAAVVIRQNETAGYLQLIGFVDTLQRSLDESDLKTRMKELLPSYMIPDRIIPLPELPLLPTGKIDRSALSSMPLPDKPKLFDDTPATETERLLISLWKRILNVSSISVHDSFFDLGGDSLTAVRLMLEMERAGLDASIGRAIMRGATIREIAAGHETATGTVAPARIQPGPMLSRMSIHVLRGLLVMLIVAGHWMPGLIERIPALAEVSVFLTPVFNLATPGFAIIFGVSLGYFMYETYQTRRAILQRQIWLGGAVLGAAILLISAIHLAQGTLVGHAIGGHEIAMSFYNVLGFYLLAVLSIPLWFAIIGKSSRPLLAVTGLLVVYALLDLLTRHLFLPYEPKGTLQLIRLYATAKFSYFNMSVGALMGLGLGLAIRRDATLPLDRRFAAAATGLLIIGLAWGAGSGQIEELLKASNRINYWKWCLYGGIIALLSCLIWPIVSSLGQFPGTIGTALRFLGSVGVLALPFFVFHDLILSAKSLLDTIGVPDTAGLAIVLTAFFGIGGWAVAKVWKLYYT